MKQYDCIHMQNLEVHKSAKPTAFLKPSIICCYVPMHSKQAVLPIMLTSVLPSYFFMLEQLMLDIRLDMGVAADVSCCVATWVSHFYWS